jgi:hypothetical protein
MAMAPWISRAQLWRQAQRLHLRHHLANEVHQPGGVEVASFVIVPKSRHVFLYVKFYPIMQKMVPKICSFFFKKNLFDMF